MNTLYYFAYGMLTDPDIMSEGDFIGAGILQDHMFEFRQFANVKESSGSSVRGVVWEITPDTLSYLDQIEGYPNFYTRVKVKVRTTIGVVTAEMYTMTDTAMKSIPPEPPKKQYLRRLYSGYSHAGISTAQIQKAIDELHRMYIKRR
jgi:hypothetical protein